MAVTPEHLVQLVSSIQEEQEVIDADVAQSQALIDEYRRRIQEATAVDAENRKEIADLERSINEEERQCQQLRAAYQRALHGAVVCCSEQQMLSEFCETFGAALHHFDETESTAAAPAADPVVQNEEQESRGRSDACAGPLSYPLTTMDGRLDQAALDRSVRDMLSALQALRYHAESAQSREEALEASPETTTSRNSGAPLLHHANEEAGMEGASPLDGPPWDVPLSFSAASSLDSPAKERRADAKRKKISFCQDLERAVKVSAVNLNRMEYTASATTTDAKGSSRRGDGGSAAKQRQKFQMTVGDDCRRASTPSASQRHPQNVRDQPAATALLPPPPPAAAVQEVVLPLQALTANRKVHSKTIFRLHTVSED